MRTRTKYGATAAAATLALAALRRPLPSQMWWAAVVAAVAGLGGWTWRYITSPE